MTKSRIRATSFAAPAIAVVASVVVIAALAAWERSTVGVYEATPTESLWLLKAGDIADASVDLGATNFQERTEKRIEGGDRAVLEYVFDAKGSGLSVETQLIERATEKLAEEEADAVRSAFDGVAQSVAPGTTYFVMPSEDESPLPEMFVRDNRTLFLVRRGTYVYALDTTVSFGAEHVVLAAIQERTKHLDKPGFVLPLRVPVVEP